MLTASTLALAEDQQAEAALGPPDISDHLLACVRKVFPDFLVSCSRIERGGGDHLLLIIDDAYAFRFPRPGVHDLKLEIEVLALLQRKSSLPTPSYDYIDPAGRFAGYRFIEGIELTPPRFAAFPAATKDDLLGAAARFLFELHGLPVDAMAWASTWRTMWTAAQFAERGLTERFPLIAEHAPHLAGHIKDFYAAYRHDRPDHLVVVHGDLVAEHLLIDEPSERLAGIIDFGDVALGDPAQDFLGFWSYGEAVASRLVELYNLGEADPGILGRSRNHFIRYRLDRLFEKLSDGAGSDAREEFAELEALLSPEAQADQNGFRNSDKES